ncbi:hypothetical protein Patl1_37629 [Pistacia atlantica]|nr:hypothetical protein Patl1_37629 [Pistacia atlantica]
MEIMMCAARLCLLHSSSRRPTMKTFSEDFQLLLFHYDGRTSEWDEFEWSKSAIHGFDARNLQFKLSFSHMIGGGMQKVFASRRCCEAYEYIFIWDEDLCVEHFNGEK